MATSNLWSLPFCGKSSQREQILYTSMRSTLTGQALSRPDEFDPVMLERLQAFTGGLKTWRPTFTHGISFGGRVAVVCCLACASRAICPDWMPDVYLSYLPSIMPAIIYTLYGNFATTMMYTVQGILGTVLACMNAYILTCVASDGSQVMAIINFVLFCFAILFLNMNINVKIFALSWMPYFSMTFADPDIHLGTRLTFSLDSELTAIIFMQCAGSVLAILAALLPTPVTATSHAREYAATTANATAELFLFVAKYYCGTSKSLEINVWNSHLAAQRKAAAKMKVATKAAWWEGFDLGYFGRMRGLLMKHVEVLEDLDRRLGVLQVCVLREEFSESHAKVMEPVRPKLIDLVCAMGETLMAATICCTDGSIAEDECESMRRRISDIRKLLYEVASTFSSVRKTQSANGTGLDQDLRTESFFICEVSKCAEILVVFAQELIDPNSHSPKAIHLVVAGAIRNWFDPKVITTSSYIYFVLRNGISIVVAFLLGLWIWDYDSSMAGYVALMVSAKPGAALLQNLGRMQGTVLGMLVGNILFSTLGSKEHFYVQCVAILVFEFCTNFIYHSSEEFGAIGALLAVFGGKVLMQQGTDEVSPEDLLHMESAAYHQFYMLAIGLAVNTLTDMILLSAPASTMAKEALLQGMDRSFNQFENFLVDGFSQLEGLGSFVGEVDANFADAEKFSLEADQEPRWHKALFRTKLFGLLIDKLRETHADLLTVQRSFQGEGGEELFSLISERPSFPAVRRELLAKMQRTQKLLRDVLGHESIGRIDPQMLSGVADLGSSQPEALERLIAEIHQEVLASSQNKIGELEHATMALDQVCRLCTILEMLSRVMKDVHSTLAVTIEQL